ncbi:CHASE3 domain-containing protein [Pseudoduganella sp. GCM10020061]|uniref:CHASE3 domain-containing protein n=1 Tax=Pseudoduganella sp. GCM10020061 TaxID=3317345 RepID=UPI00363EB789
MMYLSTKSQDRPRLPVYASGLLLICVLILIANAVSLSMNLQSLREANAAQVTNARAVDKLQYLNVIVTDAESSLRGYFLSGSEAYLGPWRAAPGEIDAKLRELDQLLAGSPSQKRNLAQLRTLLTRKLANLNDIHEVYKVGGLQDIVKIASVTDDKSVMDEIRLLTVIMVEEQNELIARRGDSFYLEYRNGVLIGIGISVGAILVLLLFYRLVQDSYSNRVEAERALQRSNETLETTVAQRTEQLSVLSRHLINVAEVEKAKLARELHDEMGANLTSISMNLMTVASRLKHTHPELAATLEHARGTLNDTVELKRRIIEDLRPSLLDNLGLSAALDAYGKDFAETTGLACDVLVDGPVDQAAPSSAIAVFRIVQESLNNVAKYASAQHVTVHLAREGDLLALEVSDDGVGIDGDAAAKPKSHGLVGMRERALLLGGTFKVERGVNNVGTRVTAQVPLGNRDDAGAAPSADAVSGLRQSGDGHTPSSQPYSTRPHTLPDLDGQLP